MLAEVSVMGTPLPAPDGLKNDNSRQRAYKWVLAIDMNEKERGVLSSVEPLPC